MNHLSKMKVFFALLFCACILPTLVYNAEAEIFVLPENLTRIESEAFAGIKAEYVEFPSGIEYIADDAFLNASFIGLGDSVYAKNWCKDHGFMWNADLWSVPEVKAYQTGINTVIIQILPHDSANEYVIGEVVDGGERQIATTNQTQYAIQNASAGPHIYFVTARKMIDGQWREGDPVYADSIEINRVPGSLFVSAIQKNADTVTLFIDGDETAKEYTDFTVTDKFEGVTTNISWGASAKSLLPVSFDIQNLSAGEHVITVTGKENDILSSVDQSVTIQLIGKPNSVKPIAADNSKPFADDQENAPVYVAGEEISATWASVENADRYNLKLERIDQEQTVQIGVFKNIDGTEYTLRHSLFTGFSELKTYRLGLQPVGMFTGDYSYVYLAVAPIDTSLLIDGKTALSWEHDKMTEATRYFSISSSLPWEVTTDVNWMQVKKQDESILEVAISSALSSVRTGTIHISNGVETATISVSHYPATQTPTLSYLDAELSTNANYPTEIPAGGFTINIEKMGMPQIRVVVSEKSSSGWLTKYQWQSSSGSKRINYKKSWIDENGNEACVTYDAGKEFRYVIYGQVDPENTVEEGYYTKTYYIRMVEEGSKLLVNGEHELTLNLTGNKVVNVESSNTWTASSDVSWLTHEISGSYPDKKLKIILADDFNGVARTGHITLTSDTDNAVITVNQEDDDNPHITSPANLSTTESSPTSISSGYLSAEGPFYSYVLEYKNGSNWTRLESASGDGHFLIEGTNFASGKVYRITVRNKDRTKEKIYYVKSTKTISGYIHLGIYRYQETLLPASGGSDTCILESSGSWTSSSNASWLTINPNKGSKTTGTSLTINAAQNSTGNIREGIISFKIGTTVHATLKVTQSATDKLAITINGITASESPRLKNNSGLGNRLSLLIHTNGATASASTTTDWISLNKNEIEDYSNLHLTIDENTSGQQRTGNVTVSCGIASQTLQITQAALLATPVLTSPAINGSESQPTELEYDGQDLTIKWNHVANALSYSVSLLKMKDGSYSFLALYDIDDTGSGTQSFTFPAGLFDANYSEPYCLILKPNGTKGSHYNNSEGGHPLTVYFTKTLRSSILLNGKASLEWSNANDCADSRKYIVASPNSWTATASDPWITLSAGSGNSGDSLIVYLKDNLGAARYGSVNIQSGSASFVLPIQQCAVLTSYPVISSPVRNGDLTPLSLDDNKLTISWENEPQALWYRVEILQGGTVVAKSGKIEGQNSYTFNNISLTPGIKYYIDLERKADRIIKTSSSFAGLFFVIPPASTYITATDINNDIYDTYYADEGLNKIRITVNASGTWTATVSQPSWIQLVSKGTTEIDPDEDYSSYTGQPGSGFVVRVLPDATGKKRSGKVTLSTYGATTSFRIVQEAEEKPSVTPNPQLDDPSDFLFDDEIAPDAPTVTLSASSDNIQVNWTRQARAVGYKIYCSTSGTKPNSPTLTASASQTESILSGLNAQTTYYVWVSAYNAQGEKVSTRNNVKTTDASVVSDATFSLFHGNEKLYDLSDNGTSLNIGFNAAAGPYDVYTLTIKTNQDWSVLNQCEWVSIFNSQTSGTGDGIVVLSINDKASYKALNGNLFIDVAGKRLTVKLSKPEYPAGLSVSIYHKDENGSADQIAYRMSDTSVTMNENLMMNAAAASGNTFKFYVKSNFDWTLTNNADWFASSITNGYGGDSETPVLLTLNSNATADLQSGRLSFLFGENKTPVDITVLKPANNIYHSWTGYLNVPTADTYNTATATKTNGGFVDSTEPVLVLDESNDRYQIEMNLSTGGTDIRWVDREWISETPVAFNTDYSPSTEVANENGLINFTVTPPSNCPSSAYIVIEKSTHSKETGWSSFAQISRGKIGTQFADSQVSNGKTYRYRISILSSQANVAFDPYYIDHTYNEIENIHVSSILLNQTSFSMVLGSETQLNAVIYPVNATDKSVIWSSSDASVVRVDDSGIITATGLGSAYVTATSNDNGEVKTTCNITVEALNFSLEHISSDSSTDQTIALISNGNISINKTLYVIGDKPGVEYFYKVDSNASWIMRSSGDWFNEDIISMACDGPTTEMNILFGEKVSSEQQTGSLNFLFSNGTELTINVVKPNYSLFDKAFTENSEYLNNALATTSIVESLNAYSGPNAVSGSLSSLGFDNIEHYNYSSETHTVGHSLGHKLVVDQNGDIVNLFAVIIRGTNGTNKEWKSNFTVGNGVRHSGFDFAASKVCNNLTGYMEGPNQEIRNNKYIIWICGHSRGAAVGNLLAGYYLSYRPTSSIYAYLFATPNVSKELPVRCK